MPGGRPRAKTQADSVKSVVKVLDILEHLGSSQSAVSVSDLARATGLNVSTAFRLLQTLMARGYVEQETAQPRLLPRAAHLPDGQRLSAGQRSCHDRASASRSAARRGRRDRVSGDVQPGRDRAALQGGRQAGGERRDPADGARARLLHGDRQGAALGAQPGRVRRVSCERRAAILHAADADQQDRAAARDPARCARKASRSTTRSSCRTCAASRFRCRTTTAAHRSPRSASRCRRCASSKAQSSPRWCEQMREKATLITQQLGLVEN